MPIANPPPAEEEEQLLGRLRTLPDFVNADDWLVRRGHFVTAEFVVDLGGHRNFLTIEKGRLVSVDDGCRLTPTVAFLLSASLGSWARFWQRVPPPEFHDLFAMAHRQDLRIDGDIGVLMANLIYFKTLLEYPRQIGTGAT